MGMQVSSSPSPQVQVAQAIALRPPPVQIETQPPVMDKQPVSNGNSRFVDTYA